MDTTLPLIRSTTPGLYQVLTNANTDYPVQVPGGAVGVILWFETSATDSTIIGGRIGIDQASDAVTGLTNTDANLGYQPAGVGQYAFHAWQAGAQTVNPADNWLHLACPTALAVVRGMWLFNRDTGV